MDAEALQSTIEAAIASNRWMSIMLQGCGSITIRPASIEMSLGTHAVITGEMTLRHSPKDPNPPTVRDLQQGHEMRERIQQAASPQNYHSTISLTLDSSDVQAILVYDA